ncbi:MAG: peptidase M24 [Deltaproteobacteria bacterium]|nr:MAG: peptidase M24 [Deltaproteobacteria bacterium]
MKKIQERIEKTRKKFKEHDIDGLLVFIEENRFYLSGFEGEDSQFDETAGILAIGKEKLVLATDPRFVVQAEKEAPLYELYCYKKGLASEITKILDCAGITKAGFESSRVTYEMYKKIKESMSSSKHGASLKPLTGIVESLREIKDEEEIKKISIALEIAENGFKKVVNQFIPGISEEQGAWILEKTLREMGAEKLSFSTITASGINAAKPHARPTDKLFCENEPVLFDFGTLVERYCSDITRTFFLGDDKLEFKKIFDIVKNAQDAGTNAIREGITGKEVDLAARKVIEDAGYGKYFGHGLGHGVGMAVHEAPRLSPLSDTVLKEGMVVTVEPGIYIPSWGGIRLENMAVVRKDSAQVLNTTNPADFIS